MNPEYLAAAPVLTLAGEGLIRRGERGEVQAAGVAVISVGVISLIIGFTASATPSHIESLIWYIMPLAYLAALAMAIAAALTRKWPRRAIGWLALASITVPLLWSYLLTGSVMDFFIIVSYPGTADGESGLAVSSSLYDFFWPTIKLAGFIAMPAALGIVLVWRQSRRSAFWWSGTALIGLGGMLLLFEILQTADFRLAGSPI